MRPTGSSSFLFLHRSWAFFFSPFCVCILLFANLVCAATKPLQFSNHSAITPSSIRVATFSDQNPKILLGPTMQYFIDQSGAMSIEDVVSVEANKRFNNIDVETPTFGLTDTAYWFRLGLRYEGSQQELIKELEISNALLATIDLYEIDPPFRTRHVQGGLARPLTAPDIMSRNFISRLHFTKGQTKWVYFKIGGNSVLNVPAYLWDIDMRRHKAETEMVVFGMYYGLMGVMLLYNLFLFISTRFKSYFFYLGYLGFIIMSMLSNDGLMKEYVFTNNPWFLTRIFWLLACVTGIFAVLFSREFLRTQIRHPRIDILLKLSAAIMIAGALLTIFHNSLFSNYLVNFGVLFVCCCLFASGIVSVSNGHHEAKFFLLSWGFILLGGMILFSMFIGLLPVKSYIIFAAHIGSSLEVLLLSFVLADRINVIVSEKLEIETEAKLELENSHHSLNASHRLKDDFLECISEELITPIINVINRVERLDITQLDQEQNNFVNTIIRSSRSMMFLVKNLIGFTQKTNNARLTFKSFGLRDQLDYIRYRFWAKSSSKGLEFEFNIAPDIPEYLLGDSSRLQMVMYNLLDNAVKFTHQGRIVMNVSRRLAADNQHGVTLDFRVSDTGIGIPDHLQKSIFEPFSVIDVTTRRTHGGLGIGLAHCKKAASIMNAEITLSSKLGVGTEVNFCVTFEQENKTFADPFVETRLQVPKPESKIVEGCFKDKKILIAEDNLINQAVLKKIVEKLGCTAFIANNGSEAIDIINEESVDLIFMDCQMPKVDGYEATQEIRKNESNSTHIPIIAVTANAMEGDKEKCFAAGMDSYLKKPINVSDIKKAFDQYL